MGLEFIEFEGNTYPKFQSEGNAARWIMPLAQYYCVGVGLDVGYSKEKWMLPGAIGIEPSIDPQYDAMRLPVGEFDYLFSSHCLEHVKENWYIVLDYWLSKIKKGGILFLYLPHESQVYWRPENNRKHIHSFNGKEIAEYLKTKGYPFIITSQDFNNSFTVICEKA